MAIIRVTTVDDPALVPYRDLRNQNPTRYSQRFIAEGNKLVERLLASRFTTESVFAAEDYVDDLLPLVPDEVPVYVAPRKVLEATIGFNFHRGCLACGLRRPRLVGKDWVPSSERSLVVVCPDIQDPTNLGTVLRNCAAFGVDLVMLGSRCADPFSRRVLRVSMGAVLELTIAECRDLSVDLQYLRQEYGLRTVATVLHGNAETLEGVMRPARMALLLGSEGHGLEEAWTSSADHRVTIPMQLGTDSLNVAVASGIFLYHFSRRAPVDLP